MLRNIKVDGFRSLNNFDMNIRSGLNVLVGPNGSGKSNILRFIDFVKDLLNAKLSDAVSRAGGAGAIFTRTGAEQIKNTIRFSFSGSGIYEESEIFHTRAKTFEVGVEYEYNCDIKLSEDNNRIIFGMQDFRYKVHDPSRNPPLTWSVRVTRAGEGEISVERGNLEQDLSFVSDRQKSYMIGQIEYFPKIQGFDHYCLLFHITQFGSNLARHFLQDVRGGQVYNIIPSRVREPEDIAREPTVKSDGSGLAATLLQLKAQSNRAIYSMRPRNRSRRANQGVGYYDEVKQHFLNMNDNITDLDVKENNFENNIKLNVKVKCGKDEVLMPFAFMSDGTVKWLVLVTAVVTTSSYLCIEEPENFIHPKLQSETADFIRTRCKQHAGLFALVTTHSQTFLDASKPQELIMISMDQGETRANRTNDAELISAEINRTGFGLGYYYVSEAI